MSKFATKAAANMFCQARYEAAKSNERLSSREGAAEEIGMMFFGARLQNG